jgi:hypothetical protein
MRAYFRGETARHWSLQRGHLQILLNQEASMNAQSVRSPGTLPTTAPCARAKLSPEAHPNSSRPSTTFPKALAGELRRHIETARKHANYPRHPGVAFGKVNF